jgi:hypothetical protein
MAHKLRTDFHAPAVQGKLTMDARRALTRRSQLAQEAGPQTAYSAGNAAHLAGARSEQLQIIRQQDNALDKLSGGLDSLNEMAVVIDAELKDQDKILEDINVQTDAAQNKMDQAIAHIEKLIGKPGCCSGNNCQLCVRGAAPLASAPSPCLTFYSCPSIPPAGARLAFSSLFSLVRGSCSTAAPRVLTAPPAHSVT